MQNFGELATAPLQPWDALVCTSAAVKTTVENTLRQWDDYLAVRCGARPRVAVELPIIPLGVDAAFFAGCRENKAARKTRRALLRIPDGELAILYVGRLNFYAKAHPIPMYLAIERAAKQTGQRLHLIQVGWFEHEREERAFRQAAQTFCPSVACSFLDGRQPAVRQEAWSAADLFVSLSDNIQETFGLTPLEAMAAGLPVVCTDWDGYRETVRHEQDGIRVPVTMPPPGCGTNFARDYWSDELHYNNFIARVSMSTAVDIDAVTRALVQLVTQPELRARMSAAGQVRARTIFDWSVIIRQYEALWDELNARRQSDTEQEIAPLFAGAPPHPLLDDPCRAFGHYTATPLGPESTLMPSPASSPEFVSTIVGDWMSGFGTDSRLPQRVWTALLDDLAAKGELCLADLLAAHPGREPEVFRTVGWLLKFDIVRLKDRTPPAAGPPPPAG
jgi:glycosyltransferase involved in cell wall biosynthesis